MPAVREGQDVLARDKRGTWYAAKVVAERGEGDEHELKVHFSGWRTRFDEWLRPAAVMKQSGPSVEKQLAEANWSSTDGHDAITDTWEVEDIVGKRLRQGRTQYRVRWAGWSASSDSWEPREHLDASLVTEYEAKHGKSPPRKKLTSSVKKDKTPYTEQFAAAAAALQLDVTANVDAVARAAMDVLERARGASTPQLYTLDPCPPQLFLKIHEHLRRLVDDLKLQGAAAAHVSPVRAKAGMAGGSQVIDMFTVNSADIVEKLVGEFNLQGEGALLVSKRTSVLTMLLPKMHFYFKTKRSGHKPRVQLVVKGHVGTLLPPQAGLPLRWEFAPKYKDMPKSRHAFKLAFKVAAARDHSLVTSQDVRDFVSVI